MPQTTRPTATLQSLTDDEVAIIVESATASATVTGVPLEDGRVSIAMVAHKSTVANARDAAAVLARAIELGEEIGFGNVPVCDECTHIDHLWAPGYDETNPEIGREIYEKATCWSENVCRECAPDLYADLLARTLAS